MLNPFWILSYLHLFAFLCNSNTWIFYKSVYSKEWDPSTLCMSLIGISTKDVILPKSKMIVYSFIYQGSSIHGNLQLMNPHECKHFFHLAKWMCVTNITFFKQKCDCTIHVHRNAKSNIWLNYTSNSLEASEFFGSI